MIRATVTVIVTASERRTALPAPARFLLLGGLALLVLSIGAFGVSCVAALTTINDAATGNPVGLSEDIWVAGFLITIVSFALGILMIIAGAILKMFVPAADGKADFGTVWSSERKQGKGFWLLVSIVPAIFLAIIMLALGYPYEGTGGGFMAIVAGLIAVYCVCALAAGTVLIIMGTRETDRLQ